MVDVVRYAEKFENSAGSVSYTFPADNYVYRVDQPFRSSLEVISGADYAVDYAGSLPWPKAIAVERVTGMIWGASGAGADTEFDTMCQKLINTGLGKLYVKDQAGARRWCWAKLAARPGYGTDAYAFSNIPFELEFMRFSDWYGTTIVNFSQAIAASPTTVTLSNAGNAPVRNIEFRIRSSGVGGFASPLLTNDDNGYAVGSLRTALSADDEIRIDTARKAIEYSQDNGTSYVSDFSQFVMGGLQVGWFVIDAGGNDVIVTGMTSGVFEANYYPAYH